MNLADGFLEQLYFSNENDELVSQRVQYDLLPTWCIKCAQFGHVMDACRMGLAKPQLEVDDDGFRPLRKAFQPRARRDKGLGSKGVQGASRPSQASIIPVGCSTTVPGPTETLPVQQLTDQKMITDDLQILTNVQQPHNNQQVGTNLVPTQQLREGEGTGQSGSTKDPSDSVLVRSPTLHLRNNFNLFSLEHDISDIVDTNNIVLGAHPIRSDD